MKNILLCSDGSSYSEVCTEYAVWLAEKTGASVEGLYVSDLRQFEMPVLADLSGSLGIQPYQGMIAQLQDIEKKKAVVIGEMMQRAFTDAGLADRLSFSNPTGLLVDTIESYEEKADLVMLGKRGENWNMAREHLGSTMERVIRSCPVPCLVTSRKFTPIKKAVIAWDGGQSTPKIIAFLEKQKNFQDLEWHVVCVTEGGDEALTANRLKNAGEQMEKAGYKVKCQTLGGVVEDAISHYVEENDIHLMLMGAYGHSRIRHLFIGSTTTEMIRRCRIPIICFR
jgi:nucleotide-binding universal stress UspA family protein